MNPVIDPVDPAFMRIAFLILLMAAGAFRLVSPPVQDSEAGPPIEIRFQGGSDHDLESRISHILGRYPNMKRHRTTRFEILSDMPSEDAALHGRLLERTAHAVEDFCRRLHMPLPDTAGHGRGRHLVIAFTSRVDFLSFAGWSDEIHARWLAGYFSPVNEHMVYHHAGDNPAVRRVSDRLAQFEARGESVDPAQIAAIEKFVDHQTASVVIHEAVHMLLHQHEILTASKRSPIWLVEGLAGSFEPRAATERFGPNRRENGRTQEFRRHLAEGRVPSIASLLEAATTPSEDLDRQSFYDGSAVLCSWLVRNEPEGMADYIRGRKWNHTSSVGEGEADGQAAFEASFGAIDTLERRWLEAERAAAGLPRF
ncbi:MAG: DUF1570 domain-containing protein [Planctomycetota bacterium]|jgi:hypothetical protein|nr:DUF1570 domain-containing protein [Planctomycetota bacterium]